MLRALPNRKPRDKPQRTRPKNGNDALTLTADAHAETRRGGAPLRRPFVGCLTTKGQSFDVAENPRDSASNDSIAGHKAGQLTSCDVVHPACGHAPRCAPFATR